VKATSRLLGRVLVLAVCITALLAVPAFATGGAVKKGVYEWDGKNAGIQVYVRSTRSMRVTEISCKGNYLTLTSLQEATAKIKNGQFVFQFRWDKTQKPGRIAGTFAGKRLKLTGACGQHTATFRGI
jgi:hypothetical protein